MSFVCTRWEEDGPSTPLDGPTKKASTHLEIDSINPLTIGSTLPSNHMPIRTIGNSLLSNGLITR